MRKLIPYLSIAFAVLVAAVAACIVSSNRATIARAAAEQAACEEAKADAEKKSAQATLQAETEKRRTAEVDAKAAADRRETARLEREKAQLDRETAEENRRGSEAEAERLKAEAKISSDKRDEAKAKADAARDAKLEAEARLKKAEAIAATTNAAYLAERLRSEKVIAEHELLRLREINFLQIQQEFKEWQRDLEEREEALKPDKTVEDLEWIGGKDDSVFDENGNIVKKIKEPYDPEKDPALSETSRTLLRLTRERRERAEAKWALAESNRAERLSHIYRKNGKTK